MLKRSIAIVFAASCIVAAASAQEAPAAQKPPENQAAQPARPSPQAANIRIDLTITDQRTDAQTPPKTMMLVVEDRQSGRIRSSRGNAMLNLDVRPEVVRDSRVRLMVSLEFTPQDAPDRPVQPPISQALTALVDDGKSLVISQSADPTSDRKVRVEVKATIVR
jgi:hypothetical protein